MMSPREREKVLREWNDTAMPNWHKGSTIHSLFERQAALAPQHPALFYEGTVRRLVRQFTSLVPLVVRAPDTPSRALALPDVDGQSTRRGVPCILRGDESIPLYEVEEAIRGHPALSDLLAFPVPHAVVGETIGVAVRVADTAAPPPSISALRSFARGLPRHAASRERYTIRNQSYVAMFG